MIDYQHFTKSTHYSFDIHYPILYPIYVPGRG